MSRLVISGLLKESGILSIGLEPNIPHAFFSATVIWVTFGVERARWGAQVFVMVGVKAKRGNDLGCCLTTFCRREPWAQTAYTFNKERAFGGSNLRSTLKP